MSTEMTTALLELARQRQPQALAAVRGIGLAAKADTIEAYRGFLLDHPKDDMAEPATAITVNWISRYAFQPKNQLKPAATPRIARFVQ